MRDVKVQPQSWVLDDDDDDAESFSFSYARV